MISRWIWAVTSAPEVVKLPQVLRVGLVDASNPNAPLQRATSSTTTWFPYQLKLSAKFPGGVRMSGFDAFLNDVQPDLFIPGYSGNRDGNPVTWSYTGSNKVLTVGLSGATGTDAGSGARIERSARTPVEATPAGQPAFAIVTSGDSRHSGDAVAHIKEVCDAIKANPGNRNWYFLRVTDLTATYKQYIKETGGTTLNQAYMKEVEASSEEKSEHSAYNVVDGRPRNGTRWASQSSDPQWISVDIGKVTNIDRVVLNWEAAYGKAYQIQVSTNGLNWTDVYSITNGDGGIDNISFAPTDARYVRMYGTQRGTTFGYSLWEFEVYASPVK